MVNMATLCKRYDDYIYYHNIIVIIIIKYEIPRWAQIQK